MFRKVLIGAASGLSFVMLGASPSLALDTLMLPNSTTGTASTTTQNLTSTPGDKKEDKSSWHFSVSGNSGNSGYQGRSMFAPNAFGPNSDSSNPMGPDRTYGPPTNQNNDPFFHN